MLGAAIDGLLNLGTHLERPGTSHVPTPAGAVRVLDTGGEGAVVLIVPDGPNVIEHHADVIAGLRPHVRVVCFDMPGFGGSRPGFGYDHSLAHGVRVVIGVMDALAVREASLLFSCANGFYAMATARAAPHRIRRLLLCQTPGIDPMGAWITRNIPKPLLVPGVGQVITRFTRRKLAHGWYGASTPDREQRKAFRVVADDALSHGGCFCLAGIVQGLQRAKREALVGVHQPVTLLWGDSDRSHAATRAESLLELVPHAQVRHFAERGHFPDLEQAEAYVRIALEVLG